VRYTLTIVANIAGFDNARC